MVELQLSQMSVAKLTSRFRLQAYLGAIIIDYDIKHSPFYNQSVIGKRVSYTTSIG